MMEAQMHLRRNNPVVVSAIWDKIPQRSEPYAVIKICEKEAEITLFADAEIVQKIVTCLDKLQKTKGGEK